MPVLFDQLTPAVFATGHVVLGAGLGPFQNSHPGRIFLLAGIDVYADTQPNNGTFEVGVNFPGPGGGGYINYRVQQSQNFPGPFFWRGVLPLFPNAEFLQVTSSVGFDFVMWGFWVPDYTQDGFP